MQIINDEITVYSGELAPVNGEAAIYVRTAIDIYEVLRNQADTLIRAAETIGDRSHALYCECGCSGNKNGRPTFLKLMNDIAAGKYKRLYILDISRLTRDVTEIHSIISTIRSFDVEIVVMKI